MCPLVSRKSRLTKLMAVIRQDFRQRFSNGKKCRGLGTGNANMESYFIGEKFEERGKNEIWIGKKDKWTGGKNL